MYNDLKKIENGENTGMGMDGGCINPWPEELIVFYVLILAIIWSRERGRNNRNNPKIKFYKVEAMYKLNKNPWIN
jgi:hypothetical protein